MSLQPSLGTSLPESVESSESADVSLTGDFRRTLLRVRAGGSKSCLAKGDVGVGVEWQELEDDRFPVEVDEIRFPEPLGSGGAEAVEAIDVVSSAVTFNDVGAVMVRRSGGGASGLTEVT